MTCKNHGPGGCCCACSPPTCSLTVTGTATPGNDVTLSWTTSGAISVTLYNSTDGTLLDTSLSGTMIVTGGSCKLYTLTASNACGDTLCVKRHGCPDTVCSQCFYGTYTSTFTAMLTNGGKLLDCNCSSSDAASRCNQFNGSFILSSGGGCLWSSGGGYTLGTAICLTPVRQKFRLDLDITDLDCNDTWDGYLYGRLKMSWPIGATPTDCIEMPTFKKRLSNGSRVDCASELLGAYTACPAPFFQPNIMCDISVIIA